MDGELSRDGTDLPLRPVSGSELSLVGDTDSHSTSQRAMIPKSPSAWDMGMSQVLQPTSWINTQDKLSCSLRAREKADIAVSGLPLIRVSVGWFVDRTYLELEITLSQEQIQKYTDCLQFYVNNTLKELRRLFLVQDLVDSLKFAVLMWLLTYVGALFNGLTLLLMAVVSMFTLPVVYVKHQAQIDQYLGLVRTHINAIVAK
ncbi:Reticulon-1 [Galemys pyrenaicus]|uniref:Reticulon n=1 Tax=Galemys pyrenaicus TaxID=202257 RepID=A0A8J5ZZJ1_GALPY|nr:Reticulon-1 [Galemys pyrenaicus]